MRQRLLAIGIAAACLWAFAPTLLDLWRLWNREPDYSHGLLVPVLSLMFLWMRREECPLASAAPSGWGLVWMAASLGVRWVGVRYSFDSFDGYSLILWIAGLVHLLAGSAVLRWASPAIVFLLFMVPLPFQIERLLSVPLQRTATVISSFVLRCLGQPAIAEGTTILLGPQQLRVEQACSGLRIFMGTFALAFAYLMLTRRELWERAILLVSVIPIALTANVLRIVITGLLYQYASHAETIRRFNHDLAGWLMIVVAASLFAAVLYYLSKLVRPVEVMDVRELVVRGRNDI